MNKRFTLAGLLLIPVLSFGQNGQYYNNNQPVQVQFNGGYRYNDMQYDNSVLSIFSETGELFYLTLNGIKQNMNPVSKIRVESLPKYQNDVLIMFADGRTQPIRRTVNIADPIDAKAVNLTLRISRGRNGMARLKFHRMSECDRNYRGPRDEYVMYYGKPQQVNTVSETTYMDPITGQWITQTTTTTTDHYTTGQTTGYNNNSNYNNNYDNGRDPRNYNNGYNNNNTPPPAGPMPMDARSFEEAKQSISSASFENTKLSTAKTILNINYVTTNQVMELCRLFSFENNKLSFAQWAYARTVDPQNFYKVASVLDFDSNKKALNDFIQSNQR